MSFIASCQQVLAVLSMQARLRSEVSASRILTLHALEQEQLSARDGSRARGSGLAADAVEHVKVLGEGLARAARVVDHDARAGAGCKREGHSHPVVVIGVDGCRLHALGGVDDAVVGACSMHVCETQVPEQPASALLSSACSFIAGVSAAAALKFTAACDKDADDYAVMSRHKVEGVQRC